MVTAETFAGVDRISGRVVTDPQLRFRAALDVENFLKRNPELTGRIDLRRVGEISIEEYEHQRALEHLKGLAEVQGEQPRAFGGVL